MEKVVKETAIDSYYGPLVVLASTAAFHVLNIVVDIVGLPKSVIKQHTWKFKNIFVSWVHSLITGICALSCFYVTPKMAEDMIYTYSKFSLTLVSVSIGYFIQDAFDMLMYNRARQSYELVLHHVTVILCFGITVVLHLYIGYAVAALLVELNSIFLHLRQILQICGVSKDSSMYRLNCIVNIVTYVVFRISTLCWMTRWLVYNRNNVPLALYTIGSVGMAIMVVMNIILLMRILKSDFFRRNKKEVINATKDFAKINDD